MRVAVGPGAVGGSERPARKRGLCWYASVILAAILLLWFAPALALRSPLRTVILRQIVPRRIGRLEVRSISGGWLTPIHARGVRLRYGTYELSADSVRCDRTFLDLLVTSSDLARVTFMNPRVIVSPARPLRVKQHTSALAIQSRVSSTPRPSRRGVAVELVGHGGELFLQEPEHRQRCLLRDVSIQLSAPPSARTAAFRFDASPGDFGPTGSVSGHGKLDWPSALLSQVDIEGELEFRRVAPAEVFDLMAAAFLPKLAPKTLQSAKKQQFVGSYLSGQAFRNASKISRDQPDTGTDVPLVQLSGLLSGRGAFAIPDRRQTNADLSLTVDRFSVRYPSSRWEIRQPQLSAQASCSWSGREFRMDRFACRTADLAIEATGLCRGVGDRVAVDLTGMADCNWQGLASRFGLLLPHGLRVTGKSARPWRIHGTLESGSAKELFRDIKAELATRFDSIDLWGYRFGPVELEGQWHAGTLQLSPIETAFQSGRIRASPALRFVDDRPVLNLKPGRLANHVAIDQKLSTLVLSYVDPLFARPGSLRGHVSLELDQLEIPLGPDALEEGYFEGRLLLHKVEFRAGKSLREILHLAGLRPPQRMQTTQTVSLRFQNGRMYHRGLVLPIGSQRVTLDGWVGVDRRVNIVIGLPITSALVGRDKHLYRALQGQRIEVPVTGTLDRIEIDQDELARNIRRLIGNALQERIGRAGNELLGGLSRTLR